MDNYYFCGSKRETNSSIERVTDDAIDEVIDGINYLTQDVPEIVTVWVNETIWQIQYDMQILLDNAGSTLVKPINHISLAIEKSINDIAVWGVQRKQDSVRYDRVTLPLLVLNVPNIQNWAPAIQLLDISAIRIPDRDFSVESEMTPFIEKVFNIPVLVAYYMIALGAGFLAYGIARLAWAAVIPWIPRLNNKGCACCTKCITATTQGFANISKEITKPWIHLPLVLGILLTLAVSLFLFAAVDTVQREVKVPLRKTDEGILQVLYKVNNFTLDVPVEVKKFTDKYQDAAEAAAVNTLRQGTETLKNGLGSSFVSVGNVLNSALNQLSLPNVRILDRIDESLAPLIDLPTDFIPNLPLIDVSSLLLPHSLAAMEKSLGPWIDDRCREFREVATVLLIVGIVLITAPGIVLLAVFIHPFIPNSIKDFFNRPDYADEEEDGDEGNHEEHSKSKKKKGSSLELDVISDPKYIEK